MGISIKGYWWKFKYFINFRKNIRNIVYFCLNFGYLRKVVVGGRKVGKSFRNLVISCWFVLGNW